MLYGLLYFVVVPFIATLLLITIIGLPIAVFIFLSYGFAIFFAKPLTALVLAKWTEQKYKKKWGKPLFFFVSVGIYILLKLISLVTIVAWITVLAVVLIAFGALIETKFEIWKKHA